MQVQGSRELKIPNVARSSNASLLPPATCLRSNAIHAGNSLLQTYHLLDDRTTHINKTINGISLMTQKCRQVRTVRQIDANADIRRYRHVQFRTSI